jgi:hypothetical protein
MPETFDCEGPRALQLTPNLTGVAEFIGPLKKRRGAWFFWKFYFAVGSLIGEFFRVGLYIAIVSIVSRFRECIKQESKRNLEGRLLPYAQ